MKPIITSFSLLLMVAVMISSCGGSPESKLIGTWKAQKVETDFDEEYTTPEMIRQVVEMQKETYFKIIDDSTLIIVSPGNTHETSWKLDKDSKTIAFFFEGNPGISNNLGTIDGDMIISESTTPLGKIVIHYVKE